MHSQIKMKIRYIIIIVLIALLSIMFIVYDGSEVVIPVEDNNITEPKFKGADYFYCTGLGYEYEQRIEGNSTEEYCIFPNGEECIAFDFITGECHHEFSLCEQQGYLMRVGVEESGDFTAKYGICIFPDNSYCKEYDFFNGDCQIKWE